VVASSGRRGDTTLPSYKACANLPVEVSSSANSQLISQFRVTEAGT
jgi:hypothetical protein